MKALLKFTLRADGKSPTFLNCHLEQSPISLVGQGPGETISTLTMTQKAPVNPPRTGPKLRNGELNSANATVG